MLSSKFLTFTVGYNITFSNPQVQEKL